MLANVKKDIDKIFHTFDHTCYVQHKNLLKEVRALVDLSKSCVFFTQYASTYLYVSKYMKFIWGNRAKFRKNGHIPKLGFDSFQ